ncbi:endonuclease/exonuclease/phosphatase family protein [Nonomuraea sp. NN258]|uniref:endonuclease/exonuclease/phosphatase family protein n=1 Tax=Nonomuraea antri TaxID=2730852 RepID=UPI00156A68D0|nr:endonuclease/exonuclease/phosphatase family protein [Nonomuraea antri]NRQ37570.1 endonuclease/exonuclease/phosphatase family protein [Nonomuraea antri]
MSGLVVAPFAVWAVLRVSGFEPDWPWVPLVAFTPYAAAGSAVALLVAGSLRRRWPTAVAAVTVITLAVVVTPRGFTDGGHPAGGQAVRVLAANLMVGAADIDGLIALIDRTKPDVLTLQELTPEALDRLEAAGVRDRLPHAVTRAKPGVGGSAIYATHPLTAGEHIEYGGFGQARALMRHAGGARIDIVSVHPCAPKRFGRQPCWLSGLRALPAAGGSDLRVLAGDFNATLDHVPVRDLLAGGYRDAADAMGQGLTATWPQFGWTPGVAIDHVLADARMGVRAFEVLTLDGTDHRPVYAELRLP